MYKWMLKSSGNFEMYRFLEHFTCSDEGGGELRNSNVSQNLNVT